jgi:hypothetical protein
MRLSRSTTGKPRAAALLFPVLFVACVHPEDIARTRAANDFHCAEDDINIEELGGTSYRAKGCGYNEVYDCTGSAASVSRYGQVNSNYVCVPESARAGADRN